MAEKNTLTPLLDRALNGFGSPSHQEIIKQVKEQRKQRENNFIKRSLEQALRGRDLVITGCGKELT